MFHQIDLLSANKLNAVIKEKYAIDFFTQANNTYRRRAYTAMMAIGISEVEQLIVQLTESPVLFLKYCAHLNVAVTEFFRDPFFWKQLSHQLHKKISSNYTLKIWVPNFSSGQELLSLLICLKELNLLEQCHIVATEINDEAIEPAKNALFSRKDIELAQSNYERYAEKNTFSNYYKLINDEQVVMDQALLKSVVFKKNILGQDLSPGIFDLILCRNNMIYMNHKLQEKVLRIFSESMFGGGLLAIGIKESIEHSTVKGELKLLCIEEKIYKKEA
jgi:chemotaxis protein methyltransferase CheR